MTREILIPIAEAARRNGISRQRVSQLLQQGRIPGAIHIGSYWAVPADWRHVPVKRVYNTKSKPAE